MGSVLQGWKRARLARALSGYEPDKVSHADDALGKLAGIGRVLYVAADDGGGMVRRAGHLPPAWTTLHPWQEFVPAAVGPRLRRLARAIFRHNLPEMRRRLVARSRSR